MKDDNLLAELERDPSVARLTARQRAMVTYAIKLTREPANMERQDVNALREVEFDDAAILAIAEVTAYYAYVNRIADGLGVELEPDDPS